METKIDQLFTHSPVVSPILSFSSIINPNDLLQGYSSITPLPSLHPSTTILPGFNYPLQSYNYAPSPGLVLDSVQDFPQQSINTLIIQQTDYIHDYFSSVTPLISPIHFQNVSICGASNNFNQAKLNVTINGNQTVSFKAIEMANDTIEHSRESLCLPIPMGSNNSQSIVSFTTANPKVLKGKVLLRKLLQARGEARQIFITENELNRMHLEKLEDIFNQFKHQTIKDCFCIRRLCFGPFAALTIIFLGVILCLCGICSLILGSSYNEIIIPYSDTDTIVPITFPSHWDWDRPIYFYFDLENFHSAYRSYVMSRPQELFQSSSCDAYNSVKSLLSVRPLSSLPNTVIDNLNLSTLIFPCGLSSFALFNDDFRLLKQTGLPEQNTNLIPLEKNRLSPRQNFILFASTKRPSGLSIEQDWISPTDARYRNWQNIGPGKYTRILTGRSTTGLIKGTYLFDLYKNVWPATMWNVKKRIAIAQLSPIGTSQTVAAAIFTIWGGLMILVGIIFFYCWKIGKRFTTHSVLQVSTSRIKDMFEELSVQDEKLNLSQAAVKLRVASKWVTTASGFVE